MMAVAQAARELSLEVAEMRMMAGWLAAVAVRARATLVAEQQFEHLTYGWQRKRMRTPPLMKLLFPRAEEERSRVGSARMRTKLAPPRARCAVYRLLHRQLLGLSPRCARSSRPLAEMAPRVRSAETRHT
jgi:hypothetical protein|eukprot:COSAG06_NODE_2410_length_6922_cov_2.585813_1_plen_130_part_00